MIHNQLVSDYCPNIITPSNFVTFVWDNNDINPESVSGATMHCTNGIVVQLCNDSERSPKEFSRKNTERRRTFRAIETEHPKYTAKERSCPDPLEFTTLNLQNSNNTGNGKECADISSRIDFLWVLLRTIDGNVPNWTGFNYLIQEENPNENIHNIAYLPAINASPTKLDTVLELLQQSKLKAEKLGLQETDVVLDQAIYAKAIEIVMNPNHTDLKSFIVLRMGGFHIICTFIAVIGKRFSDAGLRDWIIESNLIGITLI